MSSVPEKTEQPVPTFKSVGIAFSLGFGAALVPATALERKLTRGNVIRALAVGSFLGITKLSEKAIRKCISDRPDLEKDENVQWILKNRFGLSAAVGAASGLLIDSSLSTYSFANSYLLIRLLRIKFPSLFAHPSIPVIIVCASSAQIFASIAASPDNVIPYYKNFIYRISGMSQELFAKMRPIGVQELHTVFFGIFARSLKAYLPLQFLIFVLSFLKGEGFVAAKLQTLERLIKSSFYLACLVFFGISSLAIAHNNNVTSRKQLRALTWAPGLSVLFDRPTSRMENANYVGAVALDSIYRKFSNENGLFKSSPKFARLLSSTYIIILVGILVQHFSASPKLAKLFAR